MRFVRGLRRAGVALLLAFAALNGAAYWQARAFTHFAPPGRRTRPQGLSIGEKREVLFTRVKGPRPENRRTPQFLRLPSEEYMFAGSRGVLLEACLVPRVRPSATA